MNGLLRVVFYGTVLSLCVACGGCPAVQQNRDDFLAAQAHTEDNVAKGHHVLVRVPKAVFEDRLNTAFDALETVPVTMSNFGPLNDYLDRLKLKPRRLSFDFQRNTALKLRIDIDALYGRKRVFGIDLEAFIPVEYDKSSKTLTIILRYDIFKKIVPRISRGASGQLANAIRNQLPSIARHLVSSRQFTRYTQRTLDGLLSELYGTIRKQMLRPMGEIVRFRFKVPDLPIERVTLVSSRRDLVFGLRTTLPARGIVPNQRPAKGKRIRFAMSTDALAKLGNWFIDEGKIPSQYDYKGKAKADGPLTAGFAWSEETKPMKVKVWNLKQASLPTCLYVQAGAQPWVELRNKKVSFGFKDGQIEDVIGPPLLSKALDIMGISRRVFNLTKTIALNQTLSFGTHKTKFRLAAARFDSNALIFDLEITSGGGGSRKGRAALDDSDQLARTTETERGKEMP